MGWSEHRIEEFRQGQESTWLERRMLEHSNPIHFRIALISSAGFIYGLWTHDWLWLIGSSVLALGGHVYCWTRPGGEYRHESNRASNNGVNVPAH